MKDKNLGGFLFVLIVMAFVCGAFATFSTGRMRETPVGQEATDSIAREQSRAQIARDNESARNNEQIKFVALTVATMAVVVLVLPVSFTLLARGMSSWHRRYDRAPDAAGNYALLPDGVRMWNPNTGMMIGTAVSEATTIALAGQRAMVHATQAAFQNGIDKNMAGMRQRRIGEAPDQAPEGWNVTTPEPQPPAPEFILVDDKGERAMTTTEANTWPSK